MAEARDLHIHLTAQPGTTVYVTIAGDDLTVASDNDEPNVRLVGTTASSDDVLQAAIQRLESSGASPNVRAAAEGLLSLGYELRPAKTNVPGKIPENYLRIMDPRHTAHGVGYLTPTYFAYTRASDRARLAELPGHELLTTSVKFTHIQNVEPGLAAANMLKS